MDFESHVQFADQCAPVKVAANSAANSIMQTLQFQEVSVRPTLKA
jgi:hypothetical protein